MDEKEKNDPTPETEKVMKEVEASELEKLKKEVESLRKANAAAAEFMRKNLLNGDTNAPAESEADDDEITRGVKRALKLLRGDDTQKEE